MAYDVAAVTDYIRRAAQQRGIDPDTAVRVARSEGLAPGVWQSNVNHPSRGREPSYGPFQLLVGGKGGWPAGMGNDFVQQTGLDPSNPATVNAQIDFALDRASKAGWGAWYGAAKAGIGSRQGIGGARSAAPAQQAASAAGPAEGSIARMMSPEPMAQMQGTMQGAAPALFGDLVAPKPVQTIPVAVPDLASHIVALQERKRTEAEVQAAEQARRAALFGDSLFGMYG